jgi:hypothetical protein
MRLFLIPAYRIFFLFPIPTGFNCRPWSTTGLSKSGHHGKRYKEKIKDCRKRYKEKIKDCRTLPMQRKEGKDIQVLIINRFILKIRCRACNTYNGEEFL